MEYPKIHSLWKREGWYFDEECKKDPSKQKGRQSFIIGDYALPEFELINQWQVFEKIDGTNVRITFSRNEEGISDVRFDGRSKDSQMSCNLLKHLQDTFTLEKMLEAFPDTSRIILFVEGYGPKIQKGGNYRKDMAFILFDVYCEGWWLKYEERLEICKKIGIEHVPLIGKMTTDEVQEYVKSQPLSIQAQEKKYIMEGVVCRTDPILCIRNGAPLRFKLKCKEFR